MQRIGFFLLLVVGSWLRYPSTSFAQDKRSLAGTWQLRLDPNDRGLREDWYKPNSAFPDTVELPGSLTTNGKGNPVTLDTPWNGEIIDSSYFFADRYKKYRQDPIKIPFWLKPDPLLRRTRLVQTHR